VALHEKRYIAKFVANYKICRQVKMEYQKPVGKPQPLSILKWKWEDTTMHFVLGLPRGKKDNDAKWVIVDRLIRKYASFIPMKMMDLVNKLVRYICK